MTYTVAVRELSEFTAKRGDLDLRFTPAPTALDSLHVGLGIIHERAAGIGAAVSVQSAPGRGTTVSIDLAPLVAENAAPAPLLH